MNICTLPPLPLEAPELPPVELGSRSHFPALRFRAYLAHAAISPAHLGSLEAVQRALRDLAAFGAGAFPAYEAQRERLRASLGEFLEVAPERIALTSGTTRGITDVALGLPLAARDEVVLLGGEFPANVVPWATAAERAGARVSFLAAPDPQAADWASTLLERVEARLAAGARFVAVSAVQFQTGLRLPTAELGALCRARGAHLLVDAIQGLGPISMSPEREQVSALFGGAHKWLLGSEGAGFCYLSEELQQQLRFQTLGWASYQGAARFLFDGPGLLRYDFEEKTDASVLEGSTSSVLSFVALEAGLALIRALGPRPIFEHVQAYHDAIEPRLVARGFQSVRAAPSFRSAILSFVPPTGLALRELSAALRRRGVMVSIPDGHVRLAPHFSNALAEVDEVDDAFGGALAELRAS